MSSSLAFPTTIHNAASQWWKPSDPYVTASVGRFLARERRHRSLEWRLDAARRAPVALFVVVTPPDPPLTRYRVVSRPTPDPDAISRQYRY